jgi:hypothetical protein
MGANVEILDPHRAIVIGPTPLFGKEVKSLDIRSGKSLVIAGLIILPAPQIKFLIIYSTSSLSIKVGRLIIFFVIFSALGQEPIS